MGSVPVFKMGSVPVTHDGAPGPGWGLSVAVAMRGWEESGGRLVGLSDVLGARTLGALSRFESHRVAFAQLFERNVAGRAVEEVFTAVRRGHEAEALVEHETLDGAVCHGMTIQEPGPQRESLYR